MREGVNKVALCLFEHNEKAYHAAVRMMEQYGKAAIVHPTGTGKSYIAFKLIEDNPEKVVIWLSPSEYIFKTQLESLKRNDPDFPLANVHFYTYAKLMCCTQAQLDEIAAQKPAYIILDEFHRAGAECWGESTVALLKLCPDAKLLGLTATNIRYLDNNRDMAEELFDSRVASNMTLGEAVVRGILPAPKYVTTVYQYQKTLAKYQARVDNLRTQGIQDVNQKYLDALRRALEQADGLDRVFAHHITNKCGKYIVFCANKEHMDEMVSHVPEWFAGVNPDVVVYEAYSDDPNTDKAFADFKTDTTNRLKLLFCINLEQFASSVLGLNVKMLPLCSDGSILGLTVFQKCRFTVILGDGTKLVEVFMPRDVVIDSALAADRCTGCRNFTIAHEAAHQILADLFPNDYGKAVMCRGHIAYRQRNGQPSWEEWQANTLAAELLMPTFLVNAEIERAGLCLPNGILYKSASDPNYEKILEMAARMGVSWSAIRIRLQQMQIINGKPIHCHPLDIIRFGE